MKRPRASLISPEDPNSKAKGKKTKAKSQKKKQKFLNKIQLPLTNRFESLSDDEDISDNVDKNKPEKIVPVVVTDVNKDIHKLIIDLKVDCDIKISSVGKKLFPKSADDKTQIIDALNKLKINYFSYANNTNKTFKLILCGLPVINTSDIVDSLTSTYNITPTKIVMFNTKATTKMYLCHFTTTEDVNVKTVSAITSVYHHIVSWQKFKPKNKGPTQCFKCAMFGHGISSCSRFAVCMLCAGNHLTKECKSITKETENPQYKCYNCLSAKLKHDHKANDLECPFRAKYTATMANARNNRTTASTKNVANTHSTKTQGNIGAFVRAPIPAPLSKSFAEITAQTSINTKTNQRYSHSFETRHTQHNNDLWTITEVTQLLLNSINDLKQCKSKLDQLSVITNLLQHACQ